MHHTPRIRALVWRPKEYESNSRQQNGVVIRVSSPEIMRLFKRFSNHQPSQAVRDEDDGPKYCVCRRPSEGFQRGQQVARVVGDSVLADLPVDEVPDAGVVAVGQDSSARKSRWQKVFGPEYITATFPFGVGPSLDFGCFERPG